MIGRVRIAIVGFGLIGGSIARALRRPEAVRAAAEHLELVAWSPRGVGPREALDEGVIDGAPADLEASLDGADLVLIAAPPIEWLELLGQLAGRSATASPRPRS